MNKTKWLKTLKIGLIACLVICSCILPTFAGFYSPLDNAIIYYSPMKFTSEYCGYIFNSADDIIYAEGQDFSGSFSMHFQGYWGNPLYCENIDDAVGGYSAYIPIDVFSISDIVTTTKMVDTKFTFGSDPAYHNQRLTFTCPEGYYNFQKYDVPRIYVPIGLDVNVNISYRVTYTVDQTYTDDEGVDQRRSVAYDDVSYTVNGSVASYDLLRSYVIVNGQRINISGDVFISDYECEMTFSEHDYEDGEWGEAGYYIWSNVLTNPPETIVNLCSVGDIYMRVADGGSVHIYAYNDEDGTLSTIALSAIILTKDITSLDYEIEASGEIVTAYDYSTDTWYTISNNNDTATVEQVKVLEIGGTFADSFDEPALVTSTTEETLGTDDITAFGTWLIENLSHTTENPFTNLATTNTGLYTTRAYTDWVFEYCVDSALPIQRKNALNTLYRYGYTKGFDNGDGEFSGDYTSWLGKATKGFLDAEIFPNFTLGGVLGIIIALALTVVFLKFFAGG